MYKILLPIDGSTNSDRAVKHLIGMAGHCDDIAITLINVQPSFLYIEVFLKPSQEVVDNWTHKAGTAASQSACALLDAAGMTYTLVLQEGEIAETLVLYAEREKCDLIVMGTRGLGKVANLVMGSIATKVIHLTKVPVTLVK